jgi:hypothetical protein
MLVSYTMLRIQKGPEGQGFTTFWLSGRIQPEHVTELRTLLESERGSVVLDLKDVTLVCCDAVRFLGLCESRGIELRSSPAYIRKWILSEQCCGADTNTTEKEK